MVVENNIPTTTYSITELLGNKIKPTNERFGLWLLTENLEKNNLVTNIGDINYTHGEQKLREFKQITEPFCDNIMVIKITDNSDLEGKLIKKDICGSFNSYLRGKFSKFNLAKHGVKAKLPIPLSCDTNTTNGIRQVINKDINIIDNKYKNPVAIPYKIELADVKLETLLQDLPELLEQLSVEHYYLLDFDITQDFAGIFNKTEMCDYLTDREKFCLQGDYKNGFNIIVDNDKTVGKDCLTWINKNSRVKIYNKFVCQLTSPGVNKKIGNHVIDFLNCPDKRLRETFTCELARENGITRLEATIYNYVNKIFQDRKEFDPLRDCLSLIKNSTELFYKAPFYSVSFVKMWTKLTNNLENSCCVVFNDLLQYVYWGNRNTKKLTGIQVKLPEHKESKDKLINYVLSAFSFNYLPINYIEILGDKDNISIVQKCFLKGGETYFSKSNTLFSTLSKEINLKNLGFVETKNVIPEILRKRVNLTNKLTPYVIKEINPINIVYMQSLKKREKELQELEIQQRKQDYLREKTAVIEEYKNLIQMEQKLKHKEGNLISYFKQQWRELDTFGLYKAYAFVVNDKNKYTYVGVLAEKDGIKSVYYIKGIIKNKFIEANKNRENLEKGYGFVTLKYNGLNIIYLPTDDPFVSFTVNGLDSYNGHSFPKIDNLDFSVYVWDDKTKLQYDYEDIKNIESLRMERILGEVKPRDCKRLESLTENIELVISNISVIKYRGKERYIFKFENLQDLYLSNYWLEKEIQNRQIDLNYKIRIKLDQIRTTPNKNKERLVFCINRLL